MRVPELAMKSGAGRRLSEPIAGGRERGKKDIKISLYRLREAGRTRAGSRRYVAKERTPMAAKRVVARDTAAAFVDDNAPVVRSLSGLRKAENECHRCPLYRNATQAVPGEGPNHARVMLVGEQPGDKEDLAGKPFVGPAGRILDRALADAGIPRDETFVTNAVKHFKFEPRGKRRLHKKPNAYE